MADQTTPGQTTPGQTLHDQPHPTLTAAARRALAEAAARRVAAPPAAAPVEHGGRAGPEPVRFGDWEKNGLAVDF